MVSPTFRPLASEAPRLAASMMPGPPPVHTTKRALLVLQLLRPLGETAGELARVLVVARHREPPARAFEVALAALGGANLGLGLLARNDARRAHEHDRVVDLVVLEAALRLEVLGEDAQRPGAAAVQK